MANVNSIPTYGEINEILGYIATIGGVVALFVYLYESLTTKDQKEAHRKTILKKLNRLKSIRPFELAKEDALVVLRIFDFIYGPKTREIDSPFNFFAKTNWIWRPLLVSFIIACIYVIPMNYLTIPKVIDYMEIYTGFPATISLRSEFVMRYTLIFLPVNLFLDLISVNISRYFFHSMSQSVSTIKLLFFAALDLIIALFLYMTGPLWTSIEYIFGPNFWAMLEFRIQRLPELIMWSTTLIFDPVGNIAIAFGKDPIRDGAPVFLVMYLTTLIPTAIHFFVTILFFGSKVIAEPLRRVFEKYTEYVVNLPKGTTALIAFVTTVTTIGLIWFTIAISRFVLA